MERHTIEGKPSMLLKDKVAVIYGGGGAIGGAAARAFAREGATVFLAGRTQQRLDTVASEITASSGKVETALLDVLDEAAVAKHARAVVAQAGGIDIVRRDDRGSSQLDLRCSR
jgi:NADP-dependent 3-hydroxy acid dehydrogenase YdfG